NANTTSGNIAPAAAAATALPGITVANQSAKPTDAAATSALGAVVRRVSMSSGSRCRNDRANGATIAVSAAAAASTSANTTIARRAVRPDAAASCAALTPTTIRATTSGTTVICNACSHSRPIG